MRRLVFALVPVVLVLACGKKGLPPECDQYLARYQCFLGKSGMADTTTTIETMRTTWTTSSETGPGRAAVLSACQKSQTEMAAKFEQSGCANATPAAK